MTDCNNTVAPVHKFLKKADLCQPIDTGITLNEKEHVYLFKNEALKGYLSTTSITSKLNPFLRNKVATNIAKSKNGYNKIQWNSLSKMKQEQLKREVTDEWDEKNRFGTRVHNMIENYLVVGRHYDAPPIDSKEYIALERAMKVINAFKPTHQVETCEIKFKDDRRKITGCADLLLKRNGQKRFGILDWKNSKVFRKDEKSFVQWINYENDEKERVQLGYRINSYLAYVLQLLIYYQLSKTVYNDEEKGKVNPHHLYLVNLSDDELFEKDKFKLENFHIDILNTSIQTIKIETINGIETYMEYGNKVNITDFCVFILDCAKTLKSGKLEKYKTKKLQWIKTNPNIKTPITEISKKSQMYKRNGFMWEKVNSPITPNSKKSKMDHRSLAIIHRQINKKNGKKNNKNPLQKLKDKLESKNCIVPDCSKMKISYDDINNADTIEDISKLIKREEKVNFSVVLAYTMLCTQKNHNKIKTTKTFKIYDSHMKTNECGKNSRRCIRKMIPLSKKILKNNTLFPKNVSIGEKKLQDVDSYICYSVWYALKLLNRRSNGNTSS